MRYYYGIIFKGERIMKIKKWLGVAAIATVAGLALAACGNSDKKADNTTTVKLRLLTVVVQKKHVGTKSKNWLKKTELNWNSQSLQITHNQTKLFVMGMWISTLSNITTTLKLEQRKQRRPSFCSRYLHCANPSLLWY